MSIDAPALSVDEQSAAAVVRNPKLKLIRGLAGFERDGFKAINRTRFSSSNGKNVDATVKPGGVWLRSRQDQFKNRRKICSRRRKEADFYSQIQSASLQPSPPPYVGGYGFY